jgi:hypothetical protein
VIAVTFRPPPGEAPRDAYFFSTKPLVVEHAAPQALRRVRGGHRLELVPSANAAPSLSRLEGVLLVEGRSGPVALDVDVPVAKLAFLPPALTRCQVNERVALRSPLVAERFRREGIALLKADWTRRSDRITRALARPVS